MRIGASVAVQLQQTLDDLLEGRIELSDLDPALQAWYVAGYTLGREHGDPERIAVLEYQADLWYFVASNPGKRPGDYLTHRTSQLWDEAAA